MNLTGLVSFATQNAAGTATTLNIAAANSGLYETANLTLTNNVTLSNNAIFRVPTMRQLLARRRPRQRPNGFTEIETSARSVLGIANTVHRKDHHLPAGTV